MNNIIIVEFILYCLVILGIGYYFSRTKLDHSAFLLGGKNFLDGHSHFPNVRQANQPGCSLVTRDSCLPQGYLVSG